jgi:hypothetical protein
MSIVIMQTDASEHLHAEVSFLCEVRKSSVNAQNRTRSISFNGS